MRIGTECCHLTHFCYPPLWILGSHDIFWAQTHRECGEVNEWVNESESGGGWSEWWLKGSRRRTDTRTDGHGVWTRKVTSSFCAPGGRRHMAACPTDLEGRFQLCLYVDRFKLFNCRRSLMQFGINIQYLFICLGVNSIALKKGPKKHPKKAPELNSWKEHMSQLQITKSKKWKGSQKMAQTEKCYRIDAQALSFVGLSWDYLLSARKTQNSTPT